MKIIIAATIVLTLVCSNLVSSADLRIVLHHKSEYVIAVSEDQTPAEITASKELQTYIYRSTRVNLPIVKESETKKDTPAIYLGQTKFASARNLIPKGPEQWLIKSLGNNLVLTGGRPRGTLYAVYHFLEDVVGVRWWTIWDESVPMHESLLLDKIDRSGQPAFSYRDIFDCLIPWPKEFYARNRINGEFSNIPIEYGGTITYGPPAHVHTFDRYFNPADYFDAHPDYYALSKGVRNPKGQLCLTNKDLLREWIAKMKMHIQTSYDEADRKGIARPLYFSISQNDSLGNCECENCKAITDKENDSGLSLMFVNAVAAEIAKEYPDVLVDTLAYWFYQEPPKTIKPADNVRIRLCDSGEDITHGINHKNNKDGLRRLKEWSKITKNLAIWKYGVVYSPNMPIPFQLNIADDVRTYKKYGVDGIFMEFENAMTTDMWDMKTWMLAKLYEDPYADQNKLVKEFTDGFYGPAGKYIREYLDVVHAALDADPVYINFGGSPHQYTYMTLDVVRKCNEIFDKAEKAVANNSTLRDRVQFARTSLDRTICYRADALYREYRKSGSKEAYDLPVRKSATRAASIIRKFAALRFYGRMDSAKDGFDQADDLEKKAEYNLPVPLPAQFADLPPDSVYDFSPMDFRLVSVPKIKDDPDSVFGKAAILDLASVGNDAVKYLVTPDKPMVIGHYNSADNKYGETAEIKVEDIKPGYNLYKLGPVKFKPTEYFYMTWSWTMQLDLRSVISSNPDQKYEVYASIKFDGPSFPHGNPNNPDAIYWNRLIVVKVD